MFPQGVSWFCRSSIPLLEPVFWGTFSVCGPLFAFFCTRWVVLCYWSSIPNIPSPAKSKRPRNCSEQAKFFVIPRTQDTVWGCDPHQPKAVTQLFRMINRPKNKPASLLCNSFKQVAQYGYIDDQSYRAAKRALPGPYTLILKASKLVARSLHGKQKEVGIRYPDHSVVLALIEALQSPLLNVSARDPNENYLDDPREIEQIWGRHLAAVIDCDLLPESPSTMIDLTQDFPEVLRVGQGDPDAFL